MKNIQRSKRVNINNIQASKKNYNNTVFSNGPSQIFPANTNIQYKKLYEYSELINHGSSFISNNKFNEAMEEFQKALQLSEQLKDIYKINESKCNIGIIYFHLGQLKEAINYIQACFSYISDICQKESGSNTIQNLNLLCKSGSNLCMCQITVNSEDGNSLSIIDDILNIISKEEDLYKQLYCIKYLNLSLFKVKSLINNEFYENYDYDYNGDNYINNKYGFDNDEIDEYTEVDRFLTGSLNNFIENENYQPWINALNQMEQKMLKLNDNKGISYLEFNKLLAICLQNENENNYQYNINNDNLENNNEINDIKLRLTALIQTEMNQKDEFSNNQKYPINNEYINDIILDYKLKLKSIKNIYQMLYSFEDQLGGKIMQAQEYNQNYRKKIINKKKIKRINSDDDMQENKFNININSEYFIKLLLSYSIKDFKENIREYNLRTNLIKDADNIKDLIDSKKLDISKINLASFDPEISQSLSTMFEDLLKIYIENKLKNYFREFKIRIRRHIHNNFDADKKIKKFFEKQYFLIYKGENIKKINYNSSGIKEHFYQLDNENDLFESFSIEKKTNDDKPEKTYDFDNFIKILVGFKTKNLNSKLNELNILKRDEPYLFMSILLRNRSIDLYFDRLENAKKWFYGFYHYLKISKRKYKISSCTSYILFRIKCKMMDKLGQDISNIEQVTLSHCFKQYFKRYMKKYS